MSVKQGICVLESNNIKRVIIKLEYACHAVMWNNTKNFEKITEHC